MSGEDKPTVNNDDRVILARLEERLRHVQADVEEIKKNMVTRKEFDPIKTLTYGLIALLLTGVVTALLNLVINTP